MFRKVRRQLTAFNVYLIGGFLLFFIIIVFAMILWGFYTQEQRSILSYAMEEAKENLHVIKDKTYLQPNFLPVETGENTLMFFYVHDSQGRLVHQMNAPARLRSLIQQKITVNPVKEGQTLVLIKKKLRPKIKVMFTVLPIHEGSTVYGSIYVGKNIAGSYRFLQKLFSYMILITLLFLGLTALLGFILAGRAMVPIKRSYEQQREFLADASHELRTPLSILLTSVETLQRDSANRMSDFSGQVLVDMKDEIKKMTKIVTDLLTLARSDAAVLNLLKEQFDLQPVAEQVIRTIKPLAQTKNIQLQLKFPASINVYADQERIAQLLLILMDNAVKYTPEGGQVQLSIRCLKERENSSIEIAVQDNGIGIATEEQDLIFERFYRTDKVRSRSMGGSGLGLPIAKWIVEQHGGTINVNSKPGLGSQFIVVLPL